MQALDASPIIPQGERGLQGNLRYFRQKGPAYTKAAAKPLEEGQALGAKAGFERRLAGLRPLGLDPGAVLQLLGGAIGKAQAEQRQIPAAQIGPALHQVHFGADKAVPLLGQGE